MPAVHVDPVHADIGHLPPREGEPPSVLDILEELPGLRLRVRGELREGVAQATPRFRREGRAVRPRDLDVLPSEEGLHPLAPVLRKPPLDHAGRLVQKRLKDRSRPLPVVLDRRGYVRRVHLYEPPQLLYCRSRPVLCVRDVQPYLVDLRKESLEPSHVRKPRILSRLRRGRVRAHCAALHVVEGVRDHARDVRRAERGAPARVLRLVLKGEAVADDRAYGGRRDGLAGGVEDNAPRLVGGGLAPLPHAIFHRAAYALRRR